MADFAVKSNLAKRQAKNARAKRYLESREPKLVETYKKALVIHGARTSQIIKDTLTDLYTMLRPDATHFRKKNEILPFEDHTKLEFLSNKNDAPLLLFGNHNKKRPHNLTLIRTHDYQLLDMAEFGVEDFKAMNTFKTEKSMFGAKPCIVFQGELFQTDPDYQKYQSLLLDTFRGAVVDNINLAGLDRLLVFTATGGKIRVNHYRIVMKRSGTKFPRVELEEQGPRFALAPRRTRWATGDLLKSAMKVPKEAKQKKTKNISHNVIGDKVGRIHMERQDLNKMALRRFKGTKRGSAGDDGAKGSATEEAAEPAAEPEAAAEPEQPTLRRSKRKRTVST